MQLERTLASVNEKLEEATEQASSVQEYSQDMEQQLARQQEELGGLSQEKSRLTQEIEALSRQLSALQKQSQDLDRTAQEAGEKATVAETWNGQLHQALLETQAALEGSQARESALKETIAGLRRSWRRRQAGSGRPGSAGGGAGTAS